MLANGDVPSGQVKVVAENGAVYLMGIITQVEGNNAANLARNVSGVTRVVKVFELQHITIYTHELRKSLRQQAEITGLQLPGVRVKHDHSGTTRCNRRSSAGQAAG